MVTEERMEELYVCFWSESNDEEAQEWRDDLTDEEMKIVDKWDNKYAEGTVKICQKILDLGKK